MIVSWAPNCAIIASAGVDGTIRLWDPSTGEQIGKALIGHKKWVTALAWEPFHINPSCNRLASTSKDHTVRI